jgi:cystinosin
MEEESFFYFLSRHADQTAGRRWEEEDESVYDDTTPSSVESEQPSSQEEQSYNTGNNTSNNMVHIEEELSTSNDDDDENLSFSGETHLSDTNLSYIHSERGLNHIPNETANLISTPPIVMSPMRLLPPMNGSIDYSNLKVVSLPSSRRNLGVLNGSFHPLERGDSFFKPLSRRSSSIFEPLSRRASSFVEPFNDHTGKPESVIAGIFNLTVVGVLIGIVMPQNENLPTPWYRLVSSIIGYSYFIFWCASFWPQVVMNFQRKSTDGLSIDYSVVNLLGYICYTSYTAAFYWDTSIKEMYEERHMHDGPDGQPSKITVESNDVAFAIHSLIMSIIWLVQLEIYGGFRKCRNEGKPIVSRPIATLIYIIVISCAIYAFLIVYAHRSDWIMEDSYLVSGLNWLDFLYYLSYMKVVITTAKYIPQVIMNMKRKSCVGWNIWNILLDISGGIFSLLQLVGDAIDLKDLSSISGNAAKLGLSAISIFFDVSSFFVKL